MSDTRKLLIAGVFAIVAILGGILLLSSAFIVDETEQVVVLQFGRAVGDPITTPGLHFKTPFVQEIRRFDKRRLAWDGQPNQIPTKGREFISVDTTARWRIVDGLKFLQSVRDEAGAMSRLDDILDSTVRDEISNTDLVEIVRSSTWDVSNVDLERLETVENDKLSAPIEVGREQLQQNIMTEARKKMPQYGIELVDVRIKRLNYIPSVQRQVFDRMISERQRIAEQFRSEGEGEASRIRGDTAKQLAEIRSVALRDAEKIRGQGDAQAAQIYNDAFGSSPEFYAFVRTLRSYRESLGDGTTLLLGADSAYLRYLDGGAGRK